LQWFDSVHVASSSDTFTVYAEPVTKLVATGYFQITHLIGKTAEAYPDGNSNYKCGMTTTGIPSGTYDIKVEGDARDQSGEIILTVVAARTVTIGPDGTVDVTLDMSGLPDKVYTLYQDETEVALIYKGVATPQPTPTQTPQSSYQFDLRPGWNLISIPLTLQDNSISGIFPPDVKSKIVTIWGWDNGAQNWQYFSETDNYFYDYFPMLTNLETGKAYWVEMTDSATVEIHGTVPGNAPASPASFGSPWSFVGPTGLSSSTPDAMYPNSITVWGWDQTRQNWVYYSTSDPFFYDYFPGISSIQPGYGYWVER
jgi:hypothetical protein